MLEFLDLPSMFVVPGFIEICMQCLFVPQIIICTNVVIFSSLSKWRSCRDGHEINEWARTAREQSLHGAARAQMIVESTTSEWERRVSGVVKKG